MAEIIIISSFILLSSLITYKCIKDIKIFKNKVFNDFYNELANELNIQNINKSKFPLTAQYNGYGINICKFDPESSGNTYFIFEILLNSEISDFEMNIFINSFLVLPEKLTNIKTFDIRFDDYLIKLKCSNKDEIISILNKETREMILSISDIFLNTARYFLITNRNIKINIDIKKLHVRKFLILLTDLANLLCRSGTIEEHLAENYYSESNIEVKRNYLLLLLEKFPACKNIDEIINDAAKQKDPGMSVTALNHKKNITNDDIIKLWKNAAGHMNIRMEIIKLLMKHKEVNINNFLIKCFESNEYYEILFEILDLIKETGTVEIIEPLLKIKKPFLKSEIKKTIVKIQSRLKHADSGQLTLKEDKPEQQGRMSLKEDINEIL